MKLIKVLTVITLALLINACGSNSNSQKKQFSISDNTKNSTIALGETLKLTLNNPNKHDILSETYQLDGKVIDKKTVLNDFKLGLHTVKATIVYDDNTEEVLKNITILNDTPVKVFSYELLNTFPHDNTSYTQGLEFNNGKLYESTGQYGQSKLRVVDYKNGEVIKSVAVSKEYFAEGLSVINNNIYQLTWQRGKGFVYDAETLERKSSFQYGQSKQGWGLCNDGEKLYKSDGTEKIWTLNTKTLIEEGYIQAYTHKGKIGRLNELEWVNGKIYANIYERNGVAIINPKNGATEAVIDFTALTKEIPNYSSNDNVLNGIAYNPETGTLFVTGKRWNKLFEVKIIED